MLQGGMQFFITESNILRGRTQLSYSVADRDICVGSKAKTLLICLNPSAMPAVLQIHNPISMCWRPHRQLIRHVQSEPKSLSAMSMINTEDTLRRHTRARSEATDWKHGITKRRHAKAESNTEKKNLQKSKLVLFNLLWRNWISGFWSKLWVKHRNEFVTN